MADVATREGRAELLWIARFGGAREYLIALDLLSRLIDAADERDRLREALARIRSEIDQCGLLRLNVDPFNLRIIADAALSPSGDTPAGEGEWEP